MQQDQQLADLVAEKQKQDEAKVAELVASGVKPVRIVYADGGQHPEFAMKIHELSRPEALEQGPREIIVDEKGRPVPAAVQIAAAKPVKPEVKPVQMTGKADPRQQAVTSVPASAPAPVASPAPAPEEPFYKRLLWSSDPAPQPVAAQPEPSARPIPLPPRRQATAPAPKPEASLAPGGKVVATLER
jgi:hypothetical protein